MHDQLLAVDIREAARRLSLSPRTIATLISRKQLASRTVGRRRIIPVESLEAFIGRDPQATKTTTAKPSDGNQKEIPNQGENI